MLDCGDMIEEPEDQLYSKSYYILGCILLARCSYYPAPSIVSAVAASNHTYLSPITRGLYRVDLPSASNQS